MVNPSNSSEAVHRATEARNATLQPVKEDVWRKSGRVAIRNDDLLVK
jgi:hypothetical protein